MKIEKCKKESFVVIGKEGATTDGAVSLYQGQLRCPKEKRGLVLGSLPCEREGDRPLSQPFG